MIKYDPLAMHNFIQLNLDHDPVINAAVFNTLRILKAKNPGDTYLEAYQGHWSKQGPRFFDYYHLLWSIGAHWPMQRVMEIGCRTGISICQFLSAVPDPGSVEVFLFDIFADGFTSPNLVKMNLRALNLPTDRIHFIVGDSCVEVPKFVDTERRGGSMDYILVDGNHERPAARQDLENVIPLLKEGGILLFDDIAPDGCALIDVWDAFKAAHAQEFYFAENMNGKGIGVGVKR